MRVRSPGEVGSKRLRNRQHGPIQFGRRRAAQTKHPVIQALVSMTQTFIDTIVVCTLTGLVLITTGAWNSGQTGAVLTTMAFQNGRLALTPVVLSETRNYFQNIPGARKSWKRPARKYRRSSLLDVEIHPIYD
ncbi:MAG: alanine:cation symporter family protein [Desulfobacterales bacterium]